MDERTLYQVLLAAFFGCSPLVFLALLRTSAPYGRHRRAGWGPNVDATLGWVLMELPAALVLPLCLLLSARPESAAGVALVGMWEIHYFHRAVVYPLRRHMPGRTMPLVVMVMAIVFNVLNGYLNGRWLFHFASPHPKQWLSDVRFFVGGVLFVTGWMLNLRADEILLRLRTPSQTNYRIPYGSLYRYVSCPNYLGELIEWTGWAVASWSWAGLGFLVWTAANLVPRALTHHRWYQAQFPDYPPERKAIFPGLL